MSTNEPTSPNPPSATPHHPVSRWGLACQIIPAAGLIATVVVMLMASQPWAGPIAVADVLSTGAFIVWGVLPIAGLGGLIFLTDRLARPRLWVIVIAGVALLAFTAWAFVDFFQSESSTSALVFVFLPLIQWAAVVAAGVVVLVITVLLSRKPHPLLSKKN